LARAISKRRCHSNTCESVTTDTLLVDVEFSPTELAAEDDDFAMEVESEEVESEVKLGRIGLSESDGSAAEDAFRSFLVDPACGPSSTLAFRLAIERVRTVQFQVKLIWGQEEK
jgi:hypothetical protein